MIVLSGASDGDKRVASRDDFVELCKICRDGPSRRTMLLGSSTAYSICCRSLYLQVFPSVLLHYHGPSPLVVRPYGSTGYASKVFINGNDT
jgi:hypothetical protein